MLIKGFLWRVETLKRQETKRVSNQKTKVQMPMNVKRRLLPIRLALPTLVAVSVTAAWSPTITTVGTGFSASYSTTTPEVFAQYSRTGFSLNLYYYAGYY